MRIPGSRPAVVSVPQAGVAGAMLLITGVMLTGDGHTVETALDSIAERELSRETLLALAYLALTEVTDHGRRTVTDWVRETCSRFELSPEVDDHG